jgi:hypothetical protein
MVWRRELEAWSSVSRNLRVSGPELMEEVQGVGNRVRSSTGNRKNDRVWWQLGERYDGNRKLKCLSKESACSQKAGAHFPTGSETPWGTGIERMGTGKTDKSFQLQHHRTPVSSHLYWMSLTCVSEQHLGGQPDFLPLVSDFLFLPEDDFKFLNLNMSQCRMFWI